MVIRSHQDTLSTPVRNPIQEECSSIPLFILIRIHTLCIHTKFQFSHTIVHTLFLFQVRAHRTLLHIRTSYTRIHLGIPRKWS